MEALMFSEFTWFSGGGRTLLIWNFMELPRLANKPIKKIFFITMLINNSLFIRCKIRALKITFN